MGDKTANIAHIHVNPNFGKAHINPNFLRKPKVPESIHINPNFLAKLYTSPQHRVPQPPPVQGKIIAKSRTKLVRAPTVGSILVKPAPATSRPTHHTKVNSPLIRIGSRKLVRASLLKKENVQATVAPNNAHVRKNVYKVDRRPLKVKERRPTRKSFVAKYALCRVAEQGLLTPKKVTRTGRRVCRLEKTLNTGKTLLNINGVLYKSSKTKLEKTRPTQIKTEGLSKSSLARKQASQERVLFVRGNKFVLEKGGLNLRRVGSTSTSNHVPFRRIDIGGLTFVANSQDTLVRTDNHKTRNYLSTTKQKSINCLTKRLTKTNVPCPIFRKVGKCAAFERGKCMKVHDKKHVAICPKFLKGECITEKCLLSHEVSLAKMPTCRFFMQGLCTRSECPYLHKKLNEKTDICLEFLKGFCRFAEKCDKRHEFLCPDFESKGECIKTRCPYTHKKFDNIRPKPKEKTSSSRLTVTRNICETAENTAISEDTLSVEKNVSRYFQDRMREKRKDGMEENTTESNSNYVSEESENNVIVQKRLKLGELPAYIPL